MSKTLEFVNIGIENQTKKLNELKREKDYYETLNKIEDWLCPYDDKINHINLQIKNIEFNLEHMNQIKTELEALEVVKEKLCLNVFICDDPEYTLTGYVLEECIGYTDLKQEEYELLKEVLEDD